MNSDIDHALESCTRRGTPLAELPPRQYDELIRTLRRRARLMLGRSTLPRDVRLLATIAERFGVNEEELIEPAVAESRRMRRTLGLVALFFLAWMLPGFVHAQRPDVAAPPRFVLDAPITLDEQGESLGPCRLSASPNFPAGRCLVEVGTGKSRINDNHVVGVICLLDPTRDVGGIQLNTTGATVIDRCAIRRAGGSGITAINPWNLMVSNTTVMECGQLPQRSSMLVTSMLWSNEGAHRVQLTGCTIERDDHLLVCNGLRNFSAVACCFHGIPAERGKPNVTRAAIERHNCRGPWTVLGSRSWTDAPLADAGGNETVDVITLAQAKGADQR